MRDVLPVVEAVAREAAECIGVELVSVRWHRLSRRQGRRRKGRSASGGGASPEEVRLSVCIHREGGTSIRDCEEVSRFVERRLDDAAVIPGSYLLEVESRGITLPDPPGARLRGGNAS